MTRRPEVRYAWNGDVALACQVFGAGPVDLVSLQGYTSHVDLDWESPHLAGFLRGLGERARVIHTDRRGLGLLRPGITARAEPATSMTATRSSTWETLIEQHDKIAKGVVARFRGTFVRGTGDGLLATFDGPARGVRCARALVEAMRPLGLEVRAGLHTGEIEQGGNDLAGIAVHIGARVGSKAGPSEVWVSSTVKDLTAGSGLGFEDQGEHELKGVPDRWRLYRVAS